ncbi:hypothetical protein Kpol_1016p7 [Vanderwaltozyma polyspora DSM 70294]|uniref:Restriction of telomere capping protein 5 n=1 Tax=Vanderwaltozyma polyspora (strain ATCC 22028 / DSM 70294 / BCRC 21397 / CBS 2163 / NBRC 10782 / NRRL Y-8283 / UCD 57-17) TaxID=436907 RepID=RTC5_VANPO|nr:uncharacterized protein Kpol_1016p7 [Vanderwaltozyma polyspora DSM 70294]A7TNS4.1 RecName: Full=Restriction of telomere capping protein 5 [Vanderwaltozyma polyspora DSM 70294]EDO16067.1 hypothetical protein Kpol_1016p7 [Vanderwaltozyma polyspora DSM 70294]
MGQTPSVESQESKETKNEMPELKSREDILDFFNNRSLSILLPMEIECFKSRLGDKDLSDPLTKDEFNTLLRIADSNSQLQILLWNFFLKISAFPFLSNRSESMTGFGILKGIILLTRERIKKYLGWSNAKLIKLIFIGLTSQEKVGVKTEASVFKIQHVLDTLDGIDLASSTVKDTDMLSFITWLLLLSVHCPTSNCKLNEKSLYDKWKDYEIVASSMVRSMNKKITTTGKGIGISYSDFSHTIVAVSKNVMSPLENIVEHMLYKQDDLLEFPCLDTFLKETKLMTYPLVAQLCTVLPNEIVMSQLQKLYVGRESGYSMRSLQSKVFNWKAATILLVSGTRIVDDIEYSENKNPRYKRFLEEYPKLKDEDQEMDDCHNLKKKVTFAVYIDEPWRVTNKNYFGEKRTSIIELSPRQDKFNSLKVGSVYFNTIGGGIGIGNNQPVTKLNSVRYAPGNVSLTLDNTLEFGVFRHTGYGGTIGPSELLKKNNEENKAFEIRFLIRDVEVWGCGGEKELEEQLREWKWEEAEAKRRQEINLKTMGEDRALLEMAGIIGQHGQSGGSI